MALLLRVSSALLLLACCATASAQEAKAGMSGQWTPMTEENERLFQEAERSFDAAVDEAVEEADEAHPDRRLTRRELDAAASPENVRGSSGNPLTGDKMSRPMRNPRTGKGARTGPRPQLQEMLPPTLDFAAPRNGGLILQRMSASVLFGRTDSDEIVMLPLSGAETDLPHGLRASIQDVGGSLRMRVGLPTGTQALFEYRQDPDPAKHQLSVDIRLSGGPAGGEIALRRLYRQAQVNVGPLQKPAQ